MIYAQNKAFTKAKVKIGRKTNLKLVHFSHMLFEIYFYYFISYIEIKEFKMHEFQINLCHI